MAISINILFLFAAFIVLFLISYFKVPIDIYYYSPLLISVSCSLIANIPIYFLLKIITHSENISGISAFIFCGIICIVILQTYHTRLLTLLKKEGKKVDATIIDMKIKSGAYYQHHYIYYQFIIDGMEYNNSDIVIEKFFQTVNKGQTIEIIYFLRKPFISKIVIR
jgi:hypothetical protein